MKNEPQKSDVDWQELDRLVDGCLSRDEYRALLAELDAHPAGWRQCALAFLEQQALTRELGSLQNIGLDVAKKVESRPTGEPSAQALGGFKGWMALATCLLLGAAFGVSLQNNKRPVDPIGAIPQSGNDIASAERSQPETNGVSDAVVYRSGSYPHQAMRQGFGANETISWQDAVSGVNRLDPARVERNDDYDDGRPPVAMRDGRLRNNE